MDKHTEVRPAVAEVADRAAGQLPGPPDALEQDEEPRRHPTQQAQVLALHEGRGRGNPLFPVGDRGDRGSGGVAAPDPRRETAHDEPGEIAGLAALAERLEGRAAAEKQHRAPQEVRAAGALGGERERVPSALAVGRQGLGRHGNVLFARRRSRGLHPVARSARPRHVGLAVDRALPERAEVEVLRTTADAAICSGAAPSLGSDQGRCGYGPRLPLLVISPFARDNFVDHTLTDQASVLRFIEDNWNLGRISADSFDQLAGSLASMFDFDHPRDDTLVLDPVTGERPNEATTTTRLRTPRSRPPSARVTGGGGARARRHGRGT